MSVPIEKKQLAFHMKMKGATARFKEVDGGFSLIVSHNDMSYTLYTQRGEIRVFKCLTRATEFAREYGVKFFTVELFGAPSWLPGTAPWVGRGRAPWEEPEPQYPGPNQSYDGYVKPKL
ncbi:hypothetical protein NP444_03660 [Pseudomonas aeruginosa]|uniref:hypothetical protein n=1 Tax=Pseudomonas aeruginosa TaxID=287 RepID=UPI00211688F9|nr:hypothetical protein [Pseudomonas aeruginosa]UUH88024.1 hypothetical protein NP444_03660 [Pseudomonas aeruginosa]